MAEHIAFPAAFHDAELKPMLDAAEAGKGQVFFVDAAHFVFGSFLCRLWSFQRIFVPAASVRQRFNVLGEWNAVTRELIAMTNTTVVNTYGMCELLGRIAAIAAFRADHPSGGQCPLSVHRPGSGAGRAVELHPLYLSS